MHDPEFERHWNAMASGEPMPSRLPVLQGGQRVGTVPASFNPHQSRSTSFLHEPRPGDFRQDGDDWIADRSLGRGDLEAMPGFRWEVETGPIQRETQGDED